ncbi:MAG: hypothetical protein GY851_03450 [bacterium]|nr:hypothetical protein [bacterium]
MSETNHSSLGKEGGAIMRLTSTTNAETFTVTFPGLDLDLPMDRVRVPRIYLPLGHRPGHAMVEIKYKEAGVGNQIALRDPWEKIKHGQRVIIGRSTGSGTDNKIWCGRVSTVDANVSKDTLTLTCLDDRQSVSDVCIIGRWVWDPTGEASYWQEGWPAVFNSGGRPDCMATDISAIGPVPNFAPNPDYGLRPGEEPSEDLSSSKAGYWTLSRILTYLWYYYGSPWSADLYTAADSAAHPVKCFPSEVVWELPDGALDTDIDEQFDQGRGRAKVNAAGGARKGRQQSADCAYLMDFIEGMLATVGWTWTIQPGNFNDGHTSTLSFSRNYCATPQGETIYLVRGNDKKHGTAGHWTHGHYSEDSSDLKTRSIALGSLVKIERRVLNLGLELQPAWSDAELTAFKARGTSLPVADDASMKLLFAEYPLVCAAYKFDRTYAFQYGTSESARSRAQIRRPILPYLLSWIGSEASDYVAQRHPIRVERSDTGSSGWEICEELSGLEVWDNGTIWIPALRNFAMTNEVGSYFWDGTKYDPFSGFEPSFLRMTVAVPCDHRLHSVAKIVGDELANAEAYVNSPDTARLHKDLITQVRQNVIDVRGLYELWLRIDSWPYPESIDGQAKAADKAFSGTRSALRSDESELEHHGRRKLMFESRLKHAGTFSRPGIFAPVILGAEVTKIVSEMSSSGDPDAQSSEAVVAAIRSAMEYRTDERDNITTTQHLR